MSAELKQVKETKKDLLITAEELQSAPPVQENEIFVPKSEDYEFVDHAQRIEEHVAGNSTEHMPSEIQDNVLETHEVSFDKDQNNLDTNRVTAKDEPMNEDVDPRIQSEQSFDMDCNTVLESTDHAQRIEEHVAGNSTEPMPSEIPEKVPEPHEVTVNKEQNNLDTNRVTVKDEPMNEDVDPNAQSEKTFDMDCNTVLESTDHAQRIEEHVAGNSTDPISSEIPEKVPEPHEVTLDKEQNNFDTNRVTVKDEPINEDVDPYMPIAKTPRHTSAASEQIFNMDCNTMLESTEGVNVEKNCGNNMHLNPEDQVAAKVALDAFLDGIETPRAPIRVKAEFAFPKTPQRISSYSSDVLNKDGGPVNTTMLQPPPPPIFSSNSNSNIVADGIATPISLAATNRLRVKSEFFMPPSTPQHISEDYLDNNTGGIEAGESDENSDDEPIPPDFFNDLLHDKLKARVEEAQNNELEEKYSDRLKEYERLLNAQKSAEEKLKAKNKHRKKQKKSKKKSRKRSRSRSLSPSSDTNDRSFNDSSGVSSNYDRNKRSRKEKAVEEQFLPISSGFRIKSEFSTNVLENAAKESKTFESVEEIEDILTPKQRRERAIKRATALLNFLKKTSDDKSTIFSTFPFVSTVRKLPTSHSYVQQQIYENRSLLHTVNNVSYKFNSHARRFNMEEWGLATLPPIAAKLAKLVGCDAQFVHNKLKTIKIPAKLKKVKQEPNNGAENEEEEEEELMETTSSLYSNAMTQTDASEFDMLPKAKGYEIGVQVEPTVHSISCQTLETKLPTEDVHKGDEAPIMKIMHDLNENQLMAIHAFTDLIKEPNKNANAMEMYKIQMQIMDIYKMSQIPSVLLTPQNPIVNNYTAMTTKYQNQPQISIQCVKGADGKQFSVNDPRAKSAAYAKNAVNQDAGSSSYNSRYSTSSQSNARPTTNLQSSYSRSSGNEVRHSSGTHNSPSSRPRPNPSYSNPTLFGTAKHYGRGGSRR